MKNILLVADAGGEVGWGHVMRTLAVAEALEGRASVRWLTSTPEAIRGLDPPCPVGTKSEGVGQLAWTEPSAWVLTDGKPTEELAEERACAWEVVDFGTGEGRLSRICPHFGAESRDWGSGMVATGPRWMPLRRDFVRDAQIDCDWLDLNYEPYAKDGKLLTYRADAVNALAGMPDKDVVSLFDVNAKDRKWWTEGPYRYAIVPPSTIAYECMALGIPVLLVPVEGQSREIGDAMVAAGVAYWYSDGGGDLEPIAKRARKHVDGWGAERVANLLLGG